MLRGIFFSAGLMAALFSPAVLKAADAAAPAAGLRIVSLAPSVTEILFELGLGGNVVGVTRYCRYPPEAREKPQVGGYVDPNYEALLRLSPDLVIVLSAHASAREHLRGLGIRMLAVDHTTLGGIVGSISAIGEACGAVQRAESMTRGIAARIDRVTKMTAGSSRPRVLVSVDRNTDAWSSIYIAGKNTCYDELISMAGGVNAYRGATAAYPAVSVEGICRMNPEVIIDLVPHTEGGQQGKTAKIQEQWNTITGVEAVKNGRVYLFEQDYSVIPGPRFVALLEDMNRAIHPELQKE